MAGPNPTQTVPPRTWRHRAASAGVIAILAAVLGAPAVAAEPAGTLVLNAGAALTMSATVQATVATSDGSAPTEVRLANSGTVVDGVLEDGETRPWAAVLAWSLDATPCPCGDGQRTVWAQWRTADGPWSATVSDTITLDRTAPTGTVVIDGGAATFGDPWAWHNHGIVLPSVRLTVTVSDAGPALPPGAWAVSRDGVRWEQHPLTAYGTYEHEYDLTAGDEQEGVKKVWVKWRDAAGNWSEPATDTIGLQYEYVGRVVVGDGGGYEDSFVVQVRFPVDVLPPEGVDSVWVTSDYEGCDSPPYDDECAARRYPWSSDLVVRWDLRDPAYLGSGREGPRRVMAWWVSTTGRTSNGSQQFFILDREDPVAGPPRPVIVTNSVVGSEPATSAGSSGSRVTASIRWSSGGTGSPIAANRLQQSTNSQAWTTVALSNPKASSATRTLKPTATYRFRVRSADKAGNWSSWTTGPTFRVALKQQTQSAIRYSGTWRTKVRSDASGGSLRYARGRGATAALRFTGRGIAVVAPRSPSGGEMSVYVDGKLVKTVYLYGSTYQARRVVFSRSWASSGTHVIAVVKKYANTDAPIALDAFLVLK